MRATMFVGMVVSVFSLPLLQADDRASEAEVAALIELCHPRASKDLPAALPHPELRYRPSPPPREPGFMDRLTALSVMLTNRFLRWYDFSQVLGEQRQQLGLLPGEYQKLLEDNRNKYGGNNLLFWYPHHANGFTHPRHYRHGYPFQFIVHAVSDWGKGLLLMAHPEKIVELDLSTSLIDQHNYETYDSSGFILEVHPDLIYATAPRNMARNGEAPITMNHFFSVREPREIFAEAQGRMNEVVVAGRNGKHEVTIIGLFMHGRRDGRPWPVYSKGRIEALKRICTSNQLPLVSLPTVRY